MSDKPVSEIVAVFTDIGPGVVSISVGGGEIELTTNQAAFVMKCLAEFLHKQLVK